MRAARDLACVGGPRRGAPVNTGHFFSKEMPEQTATALAAFFGEARRAYSRIIPQYLVIFRWLDIVGVYTSGPAARQQNDPRHRPAESQFEGPVMRGRSRRRTIFKYTTLSVSQNPQPRCVACDVPLTICESEPTSRNPRAIRRASKCSSSRRPMPWRRSFGFTPMLSGAGTGWDSRPFAYFLSATSAKPTGAAGGISAIKPQTSLTWRLLAIASACACEACSGQSCSRISAQWSLSRSFISRTRISTGQVTSSTTSSTMCRRMTLQYISRLDGSVGQDAGGCGRPRQKHWHARWRGRRRFKPTDWHSTVPRNFRRITVGVPIAATSLGWTSTKRRCPCLQTMILS